MQRNSSIIICLSEKKILIVLILYYISYRKDSSFVRILAPRWRNNHRSAGPFGSPKNRRREVSGFSTRTFLRGYRHPSWLKIITLTRGSLLGGGYLITDIQMSAAGRLVPSVPLAAGSGCDAASGAGPLSRCRRHSGAQGARKEGPVVRVDGRGGSETGGGSPPCPTRWLARRGDATGARCRSGTTQDEIHYSFFAALTILISDSPNLPLSTLHPPPPRLSSLSLSLFICSSEAILSSSLPRCLRFSPAFLWSHSREIERVI